MAGKHVNSGTGFFVLTMAVRASNSQNYTQRLGLMSVILLRNTWRLLRVRKGQSSESSDQKYSVTKKLSLPYGQKGNYGNRDTRD